MYSLSKLTEKPFPWITIGLILANVGVHILVFSSPDPEAILSTYGEHPTEIARGVDLHTLFTSMFLHANLLHIFGNMLYLGVFGILVEQRLGHSRFLVLYLTAGLAAALIADWVWISYLNPTPENFAIGASGAIGGALGACLLGFPFARIPAPLLALFLWFLTGIMGLWVFIFSGIIFLLIIIYTIRMRIPAVILLLLWFVEQFIIAMTILGPAAWAHLGGFMVGGVLYLILKKGEEPTKKASEWEIPSMAPR